MNNPTNKPLQLSQAGRDQVAAQLEAMLQAVPADGDERLRAQLHAYIAGLRGELPKGER